jgi:uncharacterized protein
MADFVYEFEWDPAKAEANVRKHGIPFEHAAEVFWDPLAHTIPDDEHSLDENCWVTMAKNARGQYIVVGHTF